MVDSTLKKNIPSSKVNNGESEFKIPARELLILVWAKENKMAGKKLPKNPTAARYRSFEKFQEDDFNTITGRKQIAVITIRRLATCTGEKDTSPLLISTNDVPQTTLSVASSIQGNREFLIACDSI
jgi:hypothetical protein